MHIAYGVRAVATIPAVGLLAGAAFGLLVSDLPHLALLSALTVAVALAGWAWRAGRARGVALSVVGVFFAGGALLAADAWHRAWRPPLRAAFEELAMFQRVEAEAAGRRLPQDDEAFVTVEGTLRADASGYQSFPLPPRIALPLDLAEAAGTPLVLQKPNSDIALFALADTTGLGTVSGDVLVDLPGGTLVDANGHTGVADRAGHFTVFNVPAGTASLAGYKKGTNFDPVSAAISAGAETKDVKLTANARPASNVSGSVQIVNPMGGNATSVILVLEDTFNATLIRGEAPPGLRAGNVTGAFSIDGVPDGQYVVLAAFENDGLVRDPDTAIGGTQIVHLTVSGANQAISQGFKVTGALAVVSPGANAIDTVSGNVTFTWERDTSNTGYHVQVFDTFGTQIWESTGPFDQGGSKPATVAYGGPPLTSGMLYQFRATSLKNTTPLSSTEDLKGVFIYK